MNRIWKYLVGLVAVPSLLFGATQVERESRFYQLETYPLPTDLKLEVSGLALMPDGRVAVAIRKGEVWLLEHADEPQKTQFSQFASGLHEPLGLAFHDGDLYTVQRTELTRLRDLNMDGRADEYLTVAKGWGVTGNYHEYAYGPEFDLDGNAWITLNCSIGAGSRPSDNHWRGWSMRVTPEGQLQPISGGFRSPSGLGSNLNGDIFATDQQGNWFPTCCLIHVRPGVFHGHADALAFTGLPGATFQIDQPLPKNLTVVEAARQIGPYELPAIWFPYRKMGMSATDVLCDTTQGGFGPFAGQLFVGEFTQSFVTRVFLEQINGVYQGACFRFREGLQSAALRLGWGPRGGLLVGQSNRGWNSLGSRSFGLQRIQPIGEMPFEIKTMEALSDGFRLTFTLPVSRRSAEKEGRYSLSSYTYPYHSSYGGEEVEKRELNVAKVSVSDDQMAVKIQVEGLREGFVHELELKEFVSESGVSLLHPQAYYTLNQIPLDSGR
ncbi:hypothetical protein N8766_03795 [bacterium]|jgi:hypothetical protein|nr:hypothetical protein [Verrucomicrobiota bacterium]MDA7633209.1 hypothetical protein [bacterium]MDA7644957.1 hypothetical protein [bacterium]MDA7866593.1 hypothetical protein [Verrucomicrobiota bacterium]MDB4798555.1 hypothetical protein [Verrucomicrobiota bacterium]